MTSETKSKKPTIIIVKKNKHHAGHHGGAWKVAYADFVTAMMAFFLVMWLVTQTDGVRQSIAGYFRDPINFSEHAKSSGILEGSNDVQLPIISEQEVSAPLKGSDGTDPTSQAAKELQDSLNQLTGGLNNGEIDVQVSDKGMLIQLMDTEGSEFFELGSVQASPTGMQALALVAQKIGPLNLDIVIEGHTDGRAYRAQNGYSNWELSMDRANSTRKVLEKNGVNPKRIRAVEGFADTRLRDPNQPENPRNRRISIIVYKQFLPIAPDPVDLGTLREATEP